MAVRYDTLCTSGIVDDVMFSHNGANGRESETAPVFRRVRQMAAPAAKLTFSTASCCVLLSIRY